MTRGDTCVLRRDVRQKVQLAVAQAFGISASALHLTKPTFFSRINSTAARTAHDEYWHAHVDKVGHAGPGAVQGPQAEPDSGRRPGAPEADRAQEASCVTPTCEEQTWGSELQA